MNKYIDFLNERASDSGKTSVWDVVTTDNDPIGEIRWFGRWRQYSFYAAPLTIFERSCLRTIADFCEDATRQHRRKATILRGQQ